MFGLSSKKNNFVVFICVLQFIAFIVGVFIAIFGKKVCMTKKCGKIASIVKGFVKNDVDPCDDFYAFACGKMSSGNGTKVEQQRLITEILNVQRARVMEILEEPAAPNEPDVFRKARQIFNLCQNDEQVDEQVEEILRLFKHLGGFPTLESRKWEGNSWTWLETIKKIRTFGLHNEALIAVDVGFSPFNLFNTVPYIRLPTLNYPPHKTVTCDEGCKTSYTKQFVKSVVSLGADKDEAVNDFSEIFSLETKLANFIVKRQEVLEEYLLTNSTKTLANMTASYDFINWSELMEIMLQKQTYFDNDTVIVIPNPEYMDTLKIILESTPKRQLANYMMWSVLKRLDYSPKEEKNKNKCFHFMETKLPVLLEAMYLHKHHDMKYVTSAADVITEIKREMFKIIKNSDWVDNRTRQEALSKVENIYYRIGYPEELLNSSFIDKYYESLSINKSWFGTILNIRKFYLDEFYSWCFKTFDKKSWRLISFFLKIIIYIPDACYIITDNSININHAMFQDPIFDVGWPKYVNYGRIGSIIGHEVTHSLDSTSSHYDKEGRIRNWWSESSWTHFTDKIQCFIDQYSKYTVFNGTGQQHLPGDVESGENIADTGGLALSFRVYKEYSKSLFWPELLLPDLDYTQEQLFFLSFAQFYCEKTNKGLELDVHAPSLYRVLGSLQNSEYFSKTFGCSTGSKMDPQNKCKIW